MHRFSKFMSSPFPSTPCHYRLIFIFFEFRILLNVNTASYQLQCLLFTLASSRLENEKDLIVQAAYLQYYNFAVPLLSYSQDQKDLQNSIFTIILFRNRGDEAVGKENTNLSLVVRENAAHHDESFVPSIFSLSHLDFLSILL